MKITIMGDADWETDDGNSSGTVTVYHLVLSKFYGVYRGVCAGSIVWDDITLRFVGHFTNDWEIGRWTLRSLMINTCTSRPHALQLNKKEILRYKNTHPNSSIPVSIFIYLFSIAK